METINIVVGLVAIYSTVHFMSIQHRSYLTRTQWERVVTYAGMISIGLVYLGLMM